MTKRKAFTLIELLVVIAIIALLLSILMPSLGLIKRKAQGVVCQSNSRQLITSWVLYADANDDLIVGGNTNSYNPLYASESWNYNWVWPPQDEGGTPVLFPDLPTFEQEARGIKRGFLYPYVGEVKLYHCIGAKDKKFKGGYRSYSIPGLMNGEWAPSWEYPEHAVTKKANIKKPYEKIVFLENTDFDRGWNMGSWIFANISGLTWGDPLAIWHGDSSTISYADGHAEVHRWVSDSTIYMAENSEWGVNPTNSQFDGNMADLDYMYKAFFPKSSGER